MADKWFEAQLRQTGTPDRFPIHQGNDIVGVREYMQTMYPYWEIVRVVEIPSMDEPFLGIEGNH